MILKPYFLACLAHASYLVADETTKVAAVVDPQRDVDQYLEDAKKLGVEIRHAVLTHFHADFVAGHLELAAKTGAQVVVGARAQTDFPSRHVRDGDSLALGPTVRLQALETPGHTPESTCWLVVDSARSPQDPVAVFTGDTLFIGDVGRPDLMASQGVSAEDLARELYLSLRTKLARLPDATVVYPAHGAGSLCGKNMSSETSSTIGLQKSVNWAFQEMSEDAFVKQLTSDLPEAPRYFGFDARMNRTERSTLDSVLATSLRALSPDEALAEQKAGSTVLDVRDPDEYAQGHFAGSVNVGLGGKYASWAGQVLAPGTGLVLVAAPGKEREAALRLGRIGYDSVRGYLAGGFAALASRPELVRKHDRVTPQSVAARLASPQKPLVLDVRARSEWTSGHIEGSLNVPLPHLEERLAEIPRGRPIVVQCQSGYRSSIATSILERAGVDGLSDLAGGIVAWQKAKLATVTG